MFICNTDKAHTAQKGSCDATPSQQESCEIEKRPTTVESYRSTFKFIGNVLVSSKIEDTI